MTTKSVTAQSPADRAREAQQSGGRAAGYCWVRNLTGPGFCTMPPGHSGRRHRDDYTRVEFD